WENVWEGYTSESNVDNVTPVSYSSQIKTQFFAASPSLGFRYNLLDWFAVGANLGYLYTYSKNDNWKINGNDLYDAPNIDMSSIIYKVNFLFGG
ncbi:MAG: hypothetical protein K9M80_09575, partial [Candidatus Marinimicrobia bacterium]|nr:hypothetical protein [Candidatus Neomarinimicrobiota bacterium]